MEFEHNSLSPFSLASNSQLDSSLKLWKKAKVEDQTETLSEDLCLSSSIEVSRQNLECLNLPVHPCNFFDPLVLDHPTLYLASFFEEIIIRVVGAINRSTEPTSFELLTFHMHVPLNEKECHFTVDAQIQSEDDFYEKSLILEALKVAFQFFSSHNLPVSFQKKLSQHSIILQIPYHVFLFLMKFFFQWKFFFQ